MKNYIQKVLLIIPPTTLPSGRLKITVPSLGIMYIAAVLEQNNYRVKILDASIEGFNYERRVSSRNITYGLNKAEIQNEIYNFQPDLVGVSCQSSLQFVNAYDVCQAAKIVNHKIIAVMGGPHPSIFHTQILNRYKDIDFVVIGEGEYTLRDLIFHINAGDTNSITKIDGLSFRKDNTVICNPKTKLIENLDELPYPARHLLDIERYFSINLNQGLSFIKRSITMITSRGCPFNCVFCFTSKYWQGKYRTCSPGYVLNEIDLLVKKYKINEIQFTDDSLTADYDRAIDIFTRLKLRKYNLKWSTPNGINSHNLDEKLLKAMKESGCYEIRLAIESGNPTVLSNIIRKPITLNKASDVIETAHKMGLITSAFFSIGYPGEKMSQIQETFKYAKKLNVDSAFLSIATPLPGTDLMKICQEKGYIPKDHDFLKSEFSTASYDTENFTRQELEKLYISQSLLLNISLVLRNPKAFFKRWGALVYNHPIFIAKAIYSYIRRTLLEDNYGK